jgi:hypothetical protein
VLVALKNALRRREIYVAGATRWRNPEEDLPDEVVEFVAKQVKVSAADIALYDFTGRTIKGHRRELREELGWRPCSVPDAEKLTSWLAEEVCTEERRPEQVRSQLLAAKVYSRQREITDTLLELLISTVQRIVNGCGDGGQGLCAGGRVAGEAFSVEETSVGFQAGLPQGGHLTQPALHLEVAGVVDGGGFGAQCPAELVVLLDRGVHGCDVQAGGDVVGDHAGAEALAAVVVDLSAEDESDAVGAARQRQTAASDLDASKSSDRDAQR